jgi:tRNA(Ile)-lysidine synthase
MIKLLMPVPREVTVALSGGVDSVAAVDFLSRSHRVTCAFYHHDTEVSDRALVFVSEFCARRGLPLLLGYMTERRPDGVSTEEHWRNCRYQFLESIDMPVVTAHNLDDCVETYIHSSLHGTAKVIPVRRNNVIRPFLTTPKQELRDWATRKKLNWSEDISNNDTRFMRNYIRQNLVPHALHVNPGLHKTVARIVDRQLTVE